MFSRADNPSKVVFAVLAEWLFAHGFVLIDSHVYTQHVDSFGGVEIPRAQYLAWLEVALTTEPAQAWPAG